MMENAMPMPPQGMPQQQLPPGPGAGMQPPGGGMQQPQPGSPSDDGPDQGFAMLIQSRMENMGMQVIGQFEQALLQTDKNLLQMIAMTIPELGVAFNNIGQGAQQAPGGAPGAAAPQMAGGQPGGGAPEPDGDETDNPLVNDEDQEDQMPGGASRFASQYPG